MQNNKECDLAHGAIPLNKIHRFFHRKFFRRKFAKTVGNTGFDWNTGFDIRNTIGPIAIKNQGDNYSCGGQAGSYFLEIQRRLQNVKEGVLSAKSIYAPIAYSQGGTTVADLIEQLCYKGANLESMVSSVDSYGNPLPEYLMASTAWETPSLTIDAFSRAGYTPYDLTVDIDQIAQTIQEWGAIIWEIEGQNNNTWASAYPVPPSSANSNPLWRHFMCAIGATMINGKKYIIALQSEGETWGENGIQYFGEDYFTSGHMIDCFTLCFDTHLVPLDSNHSVVAELLRWFRTFVFKLKATAPAFA